MKRRDVLVGGALGAAGLAAGRLWPRAREGEGSPGGVERNSVSGDGVHASPSFPDEAAGRAPSPSAAPGSRPNVLMISVDDMKPWIGPHGYADAHTPALDAFAQRGLIFRNAYCAAPACSPSRAAVFTGLAPHQSQCYLNRHNWRTLVPGVYTFPRLLREAGYFTAGYGKLCHTQSHDDREGWDERTYLRLIKMPKGAPLNAPKKIWRKSGSRFDWAPLDMSVEEMDDHKQVDRAIAAMQRSSQQPWFVACGIFRPHLPWYVPQRFFDLHPLESVALPETIPNDLDDVPPRGRSLAKQEEHRAIVDGGLWRPAVQAYRASISYADYEIGRLLAGTPPDTVIILWSDHGWHLGPKNHWHKYALWEEASQTVFGLAGPGIVAGEQCQRTVSLNDIYPTLCELCDVAAPHALAGQSILPLARDPSAAWARPALTTYGADNHSLRTQRYRYIRYADGSEELYDHQEDPHEWVNLAMRPESAPIIEAHASMLPARRSKKPARRRQEKSRWQQLRGNRRALLPR